MSSPSGTSDEKQRICSGLSSRKRNNPRIMKKVYFKSSLPRPILARMAAEADTGGDGCGHARVGKRACRCPPSRRHASRMPSPSRSCRVHRSATPCRQARRRSRCVAWPMHQKQVHQAVLAYFPCTPSSRVSVNRPFAPPSSSPSRSAPPVVRAPDLRRRSRRRRLSPRTTLAHPPPRPPIDSSFAPSNSRLLNRK